MAVKTKKELKGNLTEDQLKALKRECAEELSRNRHRLLCEQPFIGNITMRFDLIPIRDKRCRTACTDGKTIYWDMDFLRRLTPDERVFVMAHEVWHFVTLTFARKQTRDPELWNIASDMEINNILSEHSSGKAYAPPKGLMFPPAKLKGQSAETLYDWLLKQQEKSNLNNALSKMGSPQDDEDDDSSSGGSSGSGKKQKQQKSGSGKGGKDQEKRDKSKDGKNTGRLEGQFDRHEYEDNPEDGDGEGESQGPKDQWGEVGYDEDFTPSIPQDAAERMREAVIASAQQYQREHGTLPAGVDGLIGKLAKPQISWKEELSQFITSCYGGNRTWLPPSRRKLWQDLYFQSRRSQRINICVAIDTSGSTTMDLPQFFGELKGLVTSFGAYDIHLIQCDAAVDFYKKYDENDPLDIDEAGNVSFTGGGGTSFDPPFEYVAENGINVDAMIYLTDGYGPCTVEKPKFPVLWLITKDGTTDFCEWGKKIRFKESSWE